jgi:hypothetical protein
LLLADAVAWVAAMTSRTMSIWLGLLAAAATAHAGSISITTTQSARLDGKSLVVSVQVGNTGDEAALAVTPLVRFGDTEVRGKRQESLAPNARFEDTITVEVGELQTGTWPYLVGVDYTDGNQYPFQAVQGGRIAVGNPAPAKIAIASMTAGKLAKSDDATITVKNLEGVARTTAMRVMVPTGLEADPASSELTLEPWEEKTVTVTLTNRTALAGSRYPVFASIEYDADGTHFAVLGQGVVEIIPSETLIDRLGGGLWIGAAALGGLFILLVGLRTLRG